METSADWMQRIRDKLSLQEINPSDYRVAKILGITSPTICEHKKRLKSKKPMVFSDETGIRIADFLEEDRGYVLATLAHERTQDPEVQAVHERVGQLVLDLAKKSRGVAASFLLIFAVLTGGIPADVQASQPHNNRHYAYYTNKDHKENLH